jgi:hypothetical protein
MKAIKILFFTFLSMLVTHAFAQGDLSGNYTCSGTDSTGGQPYTSTLQVVKHGDTFSFEWLNSSSGLPDQIGTGIYNTNVPDSIGIVFRDTKDPTNIAVMLYQIKPDGSMNGNWAYMGDKAPAPEHCTRSTS